MEWMLLAALGIMWGAFLVPRGRKRSEARSVIDFEQRMELLANAEVHGTTGRWIVICALRLMSMLSKVATLYGWTSFSVLICSPKAMPTCPIFSPTIIW